MSNYNDLSLNDCVLKLLEKDCEIEKLVRENKELMIKINKLTTPTGVKKARCWAVKDGSVVELGVEKNDK